MSSHLLSPAIDSPGLSVDQLASLNKDPRLILRRPAPLNVEAPLSLLDTMITPVERFFVRNHHRPPTLDRASWSLTIDGLARRPLTIDYEELRRLPTSSYVAVLEGSGNSRQRFAEVGAPAEGIQWSDGAVANGEWIGVPVALLLSRCQ